MYYIRRTWNTAYPKLYLFRYIQTGVRKIAPRKIAPRSGSGFGLGLALELGLGGGGNFPRTTFIECLSMATCWKIENHFHFLKEKKKRKSVIKIFQFCYCGQISCFKFQTCFHWEVLKHETKAMLTWVRSKLTVY